MNQIFILKNIHYPLILVYVNCVENSSIVSYMLGVLDRLRVVVKYL